MIWILLFSDCVCSRLTFARGQEAVPLQLDVHVKRIGFLTEMNILFCISVLDDLTRSNMGSPGDSEKMIQRLKDELRDVQEQANMEKHKCMELQGNMENPECLTYIVYFISYNLKTQPTPNEWCIMFCRYPGGREEWP